MQITLRLIGAIGALLFGVLCGVTFLSSEALEKSARGFVKEQIHKEVSNKIEKLKTTAVTEKASALSARLGLEKGELIKNFKSDLPERIAKILATLCGYDCERKKAVAQSVRKGYLERIEKISVARENLAQIVKSKYIEIIDDLKFDLRIFLGTNCLLFLVLLILSLSKKEAIPHLFLPGILLFVATIISSGIYIFGQDWFYTIIYNDYMGFPYLGYALIIFGLLMDIALNRARITTEIINAILEAMGKAITLVPC